MSLEIHFHILAAHSKALYFSEKAYGVWLTDAELPLFICPLALSARAAGTTGRRLQEIKRAAAWCAVTWPQKMPPGSHN